MRVEHDRGLDLAGDCLLVAPCDGFDYDNTYQLGIGEIVSMQVTPSLAQRVLEPLVVSTIVRGWTTVLESQRFALRAPAKNCPAIQKTIASMEKDGIRGAARLLLTAAPAVAFELGADWEELLKRVAR